LKEVTLTLKQELPVPVDAREISPNNFREKSVKDIEGLKIWTGNRQVALAEVFKVAVNSDGSDDEVRVRVVGNASKIRKIGYRTSSGCIVVEGNAGMYVGEEMSGGSIVVAGDAGSWLGMKMKGGQIEVKGNAGDYVGSGYRGTAIGMKGGAILIHGNAGQEVGCWMKDGTIRIKGNTGLMPGMHMQGGTVCIEGNCEGRAGAQMRGGKVIIFGKASKVLPSFAFEEIKDKIKIGEEKIQGPFYVFSGDMNEKGTGKLSVNAPNNPQLNWCEKYVET